ncbi:MAG: hypothetical protein HOE83_03600 [Alphaproteobacteria bacterium]|jgi:hypothetical protein|nr:hypothetical protein [Alphaproteobacteria bacterium]
MSNYDPAELDALFVRCRSLLGPETFERVVNSPPRWSGFATALEAAIKNNDGVPAKVSDVQIEGAFNVAVEIWPFELEMFADDYINEGVS